jgi:hypothetical protein
MLPRYNTHRQRNNVRALRAHVRPFITHPPSSHALHAPRTTRDIAFIFHRDAHSDARPPPTPQSALPPDGLQERLIRGLLGGGIAQTFCGFGSRQGRSFNRFLIRLIRRRRPHLLQKGGNLWGHRGLGRHGREGDARV